MSERETSDIRKMEQMEYRFLWAIDLRRVAFYKVALGVERVISGLFFVMFMLYVNYPLIVETSQ